MDTRTGFHFLNLVIELHGSEYRSAFMGAIGTKDLELSRSDELVVCKRQTNLSKVLACCHESAAYTSWWLRLGAGIPGTACTLESTRLLVGGEVDP